MKGSSRIARTYLEKYLQGSGVAQHGGPDGAGGLGLDHEARRPRERTVIYVCAGVGRGGMNG